MAMTVRDFVDGLGRLRADVKEAAAPPEAVVERLTSLTARLRQDFTPEALKAAIASGASVASDLEEGLTTLQMLWMSRRG